MHSESSMSVRWCVTFGLSILCLIGCKDDDVEWERVNGNADSLFVQVTDAAEPAAEPLTIDLTPVIDRDNTLGTARSTQAWVLWEPSTSSRSRCPRTSRSSSSA